ncbi:uncharacterized protein [Callorhinus ursinus]|uniref:uncharacterized protein n=1 Tax=Callorhinus ursinus TaxID=34884 RepID=UPI003CD00C7C
MRPGRQVALLLREPLPGPGIRDAGPLARRKELRPWKTGVLAARGPALGAGPQMTRPWSGAAVGRSDRSLKCAGELGSASCTFAVHRGEGNIPGRCVGLRGREDPSWSSEPPPAVLRVSVPAREEDPGPEPSPKLRAPGGGPGASCVRRPPLPLPETPGTRVPEPHRHRDPQHGQPPGGEGGGPSCWLQTQHHEAGVLPQAQLYPCDPCPRDTLRSLPEHGPPAPHLTPSLCSPPELAIPSSALGGAT